MDAMGRLWHNLALLDFPPNGRTEKGHAVGTAEGGLSVDDLIGREAAIEFAKEQMVKGTGAYSKGWNTALLVMKSALNNHDAIPSAPAVPLDKLCEWLSEEGIRIPCKFCPDFVCDRCTVITSCPSTADDWRRVITEKMEG